MASVVEIKEFRRESPRHLETTDMALFVRTSSEAMYGWDRSKIVDALLRETFIDEGTAEDISLEVENDIRRSGIKVITAPLIREMVNAKLLERGLEGVRRLHTRLGVPLYDVAGFFMRGLTEGYITSRAAAISYSVFLAIFPFLIFHESLTSDCSGW